MPDPRIGVMLTLNGMESGKVYNNVDVADALEALANKISKDGKILVADLTHPNSGITIQVRTENLR